MFKKNYEVAFLWKFDFVQAFVKLYKICFNFLILKQSLTECSCEVIKFKTKKD